MPDKIKEVLDIAFKYGQIDGSHHKAWVIDQMVRKLLVTQEAYDSWVNNYCNGDIGEESYLWDIGIAP